MTLEQRLTALVQAIGADIKGLLVARGDLSTLSTTAKNDLVSAINELQAEVTAAAGGGAVIDDVAGDGSTTVTWSANKIFDELVALKAAILDGADPAFDTLRELQTELSDQDSVVNNLLTTVGETVRYTVQALTGAQQVQARANIGALSAIEIGNPDADLVLVYTTAKA